MNNTKAVLKYSFFTSSLTRALKGSKIRLHCNVDGDGMIYICNGYFIVKLTGAEYDALVRPVTQRDAGNWVLSENGETSAEPVNLVDILNNDAKNAAHSIAVAPMSFDFQPKGKTQLVGYYSETGDFVAAFNATYAAIVSPTLERKSSGSVSPMVVYDAASPVAMILPVKIDDKPNMIRTIRAWFTDDAAQPQTDKTAEKLRRRANDMEAIAKQNEDENRQFRRQIEELQAAIASKNEQIEALTARLNAQPEPQPQETAANTQPQDKVAALVEKLAAFPNVTATVKGAQTAAPVVWLSGDTDTHKAEIEKMGGKWSGKRSAWYLKIV